MIVVNFCCFYFRVISSLRARLPAYTCNYVLIKRTCRHRLLGLQTAPWNICKYGKIDHLLIKLLHYYALHNLILIIPLWNITSSNALVLNFWFIILSCYANSVIISDNYVADLFNIYSPASLASETLIIPMFFSHLHTRRVNQNPICSAGNHPGTDLLPARMLCHRKIKNVASASLKTFFKSPLLCATSCAEINNVS